MAAPVCTVSGVVTDGIGTAWPRAIVRARILDAGKGLVRDGVAVELGTVAALTGTSGEWAVALPQGARIRLEIPAAGVNHVGLLPSSSAVTFLAARGAHFVRPLACRRLDLPAR